MPFRKKHGKLNKGNGWVIEITDYSPDLEQRMDDNVDAIVRKTTLDISGDAKASLSGARGGRVYDGHTASAPGEPPATWRGDLANSFKELFPEKHVGVVAVTSDHALPLEYGTRNMQPRPFLKPAVERQRGDFENALRAVFK